MAVITLKDGSTKEIESGISAFELARSISEGLARAACAVELNGKVCDLRTTIDDDCTVNFLTFDSEGGRHTFNHTCSHVMAQAVKRLYPDAKLTIGPSIDSGFYYDFDVEKPFSPEDLTKIEAEMKKIITENPPIERFVLPVDEAAALMESKGEPYKVELVKDNRAVFFCFWAPDGPSAVR